MLSVDPKEKFLIKPVGSTYFSKDEILLLERGLIYVTTLLNSF